MDDDRGAGAAVVLKVHCASIQCVPRVRHGTSSRRLVPIVHPPALTRSMALFPAEYLNNLVRPLGGT